MKHYFTLFLFIILAFYTNAQRFHTNEDQTLTVCDTDLTPGGISADSVLICQNPQEGTATISGNCINYTPNTNYFGYDSLCVSFCIGGICVDSMVNITINPVGENHNFSIPEDASYFACEAVLAGGSDVVFTINSVPTYGVAGTNPACITYNAGGTNYVGYDTVGIIMCVDTLCDTSNIIFNMTPVTETINVVDSGNGVSICYADLMTVLDSFSTISITTQPSPGTASVNGNTNCVDYVPDPAVVATGNGGTDQLSIQVCNPNGICDITNVNINILGFTVVNNTNATQLAQSLAGNGVTVDTAWLNCNNAGSGSFINAPGALGIKDGVILTTGKVSNVNNDPSFFPAYSDQQLGGVGDSHLNALLSSMGETYVTYDACVLEFDIQVLGDSLTFNYAMGSEEYNEYVCGAYNDVFGFFISGPNPVGPNYNSQNVALIPGTNTPVAINTVNNGSVGVLGGGGTGICDLSNSSYFNGPIPSIVYDGNTVVLQAKSLTVPCQTYHFKLAIADGGDDNFDSGVFLEAGSFQSIPVSIASQTNLGNAFTNAIEGCVEGEFIFELTSPLSNDYTVHFGVGGTATNGVDYQTIADSIVIPAGDTSFTVNINTIDDGVTEPTETIKLYLLNPCTNLAYDSAEILLIDAIPFNLTTQNALICPGDSTELSAVVSGANSGAATYLWTQDGTVLSPNTGTTIVVPDTSKWYYVEYTLGACTQSDSIFIEVSEFSVDIDSSSISCPGTNDGSLWLTPQNNIGNVTYSWNPSGSTDSIINNLAPNTYIYTATDQSGLHCGTITDSVTLTEPAGLSINYDSTNISCKNANDGTITLTSLQANANYEVAVYYEGTILYPLQPYTSNASGEILFNGLASGLYDSIYVLYVASSCDNSISVNLEEPDSLLTTINLSNTIACYGETADSLFTTTTGGTLPYTYTWSNSATTPTITNVSAGTYWVQITDVNNCQTSDTLVVTQPDSIYFTLASDSATCFGYNDGKAYIDSISGGFTPYSYTWDANAANQSTDTAFNLTQGTYSVVVTDNSNCSFTKTITVEEPLEIQLSETHNNITCNGETTGSIDITVTNGVLPFIYSWVGPNGYTASTEDINNLASGIYSLTFSDAKGCEDTISVNIVEPTALSLSVSSTNITCKDLDNGTATVTVSGATPNYTYAWNGGTNPTNSTVSNLAPGTYQVVVTDANGCQDSILSQAITEPDSLLLTVDNITNISCNGGNDGTIAVSTQGGTPNYTYSWTNGGGSNEDLNNATAGTYTLTVTDVNNCTYTVTETITEPTAIQINLSGTDIDCFGASTGAIDATVSGGTVTSSYTYAWSSSNGFTTNTEDITNVEAGTYTLTVTDDNNCTETATVTLNQPATVEITIDMTPVNCFGGNDGTLTAGVTTGGTIPFTYLWDATTGNQAGTTASNLGEGTYTVEVTDANNCTYTESATVTEPSTPLSLTIDSTDISCAGYDDGTATVVATGGTPNYTYSWTNANGQTSVTVTNLGAGVVSVTVTDANNCTETISTTINEPTPLVLIATPDSANCWGENSGSISLTASGGTGFGYLYSINNGVDFQNDTLFTGLSAGVYNQIVVQDLGSSTECISQPIQTIVDQPDYFTFNINPADTTLQLSETVSLELVVDSPYTVNDITAISWNPTEGLNCTDCINPEVLSYEHYTEYEALVSYIGDDEVWCTQTSTTVIQVENNLNLYIPNAFTPSSFDNVNSTFQIYGEGIEHMEMKVFNRWGEMIFFSTNQLEGWDGTYKGKDQNPGVYSYYVYVKYLDNKEVKRKGSITLLR